MEKAKRHDRMRQKLAELCELLPYNDELKKSLDSQTILRLTISTMRVMKSSKEKRQFENFTEDSQELNQNNPTANEYENLLLQYSHQFFIVLDQSLTIFYLSSNANQYINTMSNKLIGQSLSKIIYSDDLIELNKLFQSLRSKPNQKKQNFVCYCRLKTPIKKFTYQYNTIPGYKLYKINGSVDTCEGGLIHALCKPVFIDEMVDRPMEEHIFITLLSVDTMTILYQDQRACQYTNYEIDEVKGQSAMGFLHTSFIDTLGPAFVLLFEKGEAMTDEYLSRSRDGWIWLRSRTAFYHASEQDRKEGKRKIMITIAQVLGGTRHISTAASQKYFAAKALPINPPIPISGPGPIADPSLAPMTAQFPGMSIQDPMQNPMLSHMQAPVNMPMQAPMHSPGTPPMADPFIVRMQSSMNQLPMNQLPMNQLPMNHSPMNQLPMNQSHMNQLPMNQLPMNQLPMNQLPMNHSHMNHSPMNQSPMNQSPMNQLPMNQSHMNHSPMNQLPMNQSHMNHSPMNQLPMNHSPMNQLPMNQLPMNQSPMNQLPMNHSPMNHSPMNHSPMNQLPMNHSPMNQLPMNHSPMNQLPMNHSPMNQSHMNHSPMNQLPMNHSPMNQSPMNHLPMNQSPMNQSPMNQLPMNQSPMNQLPMNQLPMNQLPMNQLPMNQSHMNQSHMNQSHMNQLPMNQLPMNQSHMNQSPNINTSMSDPFLVRMPMASSIPRPIMAPMVPVERGPSLRDLVPMLQDPTQAYSLLQYDHSPMVANTHTEKPLFDVANSAPGNTSVADELLVQQLYALSQPQPQSNHIDWNPTFGTGLFVDRDVNFTFSSAENVNDLPHAQLQPINPQQFPPQPTPAPNSHRLK